jgi:hypothetical protein
MKKITSLLSIGALSIGIQSASANLIFDGNFNAAGTSINVSNFGFIQTPNVYSGNPVVGWQTTHIADYIEIWGPDMDPPSGTTYFAEMNAGEVASLYQVITAPNTSPFDIFFQHKGRAGIDKAGFSLIDIGSATGWTRGSGTVRYQTVFESPSSGWSTYSADNIFTPLSGRNYAVVFDSISAAGGDQTIGNLIANIRFGSGVFDPSATLVTSQSFTPSYGPAGGGGTAAVPEPGQVAASLLLLGGIGGYVFLKRRKAAKPAVATLTA